MGQVWRATDQVLGRQVAIKLLRPEYANHPGTLNRFRSEARHAASLTHACIARVYDYADAGSAGSPYLVMELVDGPSLLTVLTAGPISSACAMDVIGQVASALAAAHRAGLIHRDIKPANILISPEGQVKITDFGIAHAVGSASVTDPKLVMGTSQYLAPERIAGGPGTPASDLYSLGIVLHECLTGAPPFTGSVAEVMASHLHMPLPPLPPEVAPEVQELAAWLTAKDPSARLSDAGELAAIARRLHTALAARAEPGPNARTVPVVHVRQPAGASASGPEPTAAMWEPAAPSAAGLVRGGFPANPPGIRARLARLKHIWVPRSASQHLKAMRSVGKAPLTAGAVLLVGGGLAGWLAVGGPDALLAANHTPAGTVTVHQAPLRAAARTSVTPGHAPASHSPVRRASKVPHKRKPHKISRRRPRRR
jgi:serine/threonine-protein kinase